MKKSLFNKTLVSALILSMTFVSFAKEPAKTVETDSYSEETAKNNTPEQDSYKESDQSDSTIINTDSTKKSIHNPFEGMFSTKQSKYIFYDKMELSTGTVGIKIKPKEAEIFVNPKTKTPGIQVYYQSAWYNFMFDDKAYALIAEGLEKYLVDFENHNLIKNNYMKTRKIYSSKGKCRVEWGSVKIMQNYYGDAYFHVGYEFKKNSPYFCIIVKDCENIAKDQGAYVQEESIEVQLYFTKAQAKDLLSKINKSEYLKALAGTFDENAPSQSDEY